MNNEFEQVATEDIAEDVAGGVDSEELADLLEDSSVAEAAAAADLPELAIDGAKGGKIEKDAANTIQNIIKEKEANRNIKELLKEKQGINNIKDLLREKEGVNNIKELLKEKQSVNNIKEALKELGKKDPNGKEVKDAGKEPVKEGAKEAIKEAVKDAAAKEAAKEAIKEAVKEAAAKEALKEAAKEVGEKAVVKKFDAAAFNAGNAKAIAGVLANDIGQHGKVTAESMRALQKYFKLAGETAGENGQAAFMRNLQIALQDRGLFALHAPGQPNENGVTDHRLVITDKNGKQVGEANFSSSQPRRRK